MHTGLLIVRLALGTAMLLQGFTKLTRSGRRDTAAFFADVGFGPAAPLALLAGLTELVAGTMLAVGFATPLALAGLIGVLVPAAAVNAGNGYWNASGGAEYPIFAGTVAMGLAFTGAGAFSLDAMIGWGQPADSTAVITIAVATLSALPLLVRRSVRLRRTAGPAAVADVADVERTAA